MKSILLLLIIGFSLSAQTLPVGNTNAPLPQVSKRVFTKECPNRDCDQQVTSTRYRYIGTFSTNGVTMVHDSVEFRCPRCKIQFSEELIAPAKMTKMKIVKSSHSLVSPKN